MKKVCAVICVFFLLAIPMRAEVANEVYVPNWVDSTYQQLTLAERIGQLIDLRISPNPDNLDTLVEIIRSNHIGSITITGGNVQSTVELISRLHKVMKVPVYVTAESVHSFNLPFRSATTFPEPSTFALAGEEELLTDAIGILSEVYRDLHVNGVFYNPNSLVISESGLRNRSQLPDQQAAYFTNVAADYLSNQLNPNTDIHFDFRQGAGTGSAYLASWSQSQWNKMVKSQHLDPASVTNKNAVMTIKSLPVLDGEQAANFNKKVIAPVIRKGLRFKGILACDFDALSMVQDKDKFISARALLKIGADKLVISSDVASIVEDIMLGIEGRYYKKAEISSKVKQVLAQKHLSGLSTFSPGKNLQNPLQRMDSPAQKMISYQVYTKAAMVEYAKDKELPFEELSGSNFASVVLGYSELNTFQETLEKFAPFVHYRLPDAAFDPYVLANLSEQLIKFDHVVIGIHTSGLLSMDHTLLQFLHQLNDHSDVVLVFIGKSIDSKDLADFKFKISVHEDNFFAQQIAGQLVFTAGLEQRKTGRLVYGIPEMEGMDSRSLEKIDEIVNEAISIGAIPGCQVLVARNGKVLLEKGYGHYTYDSLMPVNSRSIYDLASITKIGATTPALMKLVEEGKIFLDAPLEMYMPELDGTNKSSLHIRDILSHHSGLRAFYPFWKNTIEDQDRTLSYYRSTPNDQFANTVAYGMFATEELTDSLWNWTINTKLRRLPWREKTYDYKYSDLGFYLLQVLAERSSGLSLDAYVDSVFYQPLGMSTLTFNPLCKFPLRRIVPTERDTEFRHVLVWGTVHDQIAAMKGGVSGHAGLFGNAHDVAKMLQMQLQDGRYGGKKYFQKRTIEDFTSYYNDESRRGLGWDKPEREEEYSPASRYASHDSFGHRGFTGTIGWADPTFNLIFVFLSNRIYPDVANSKLGDFNIRERIHDVVYESMWNFEKQFSTY